MIEKIIDRGNYGIKLELKGSILVIHELGDAEGFPKEVVLFGVEVGILRDFLIENEKEIL